MSKSFTLKNANEFTLEELSALSPRSLTKILDQMTNEHKQELLDECLMRIEVATARGTAVGNEWADSRGVTRFPSPYVLAKKYTYLYTCIAGWATEADLEARSREKIEKEGFSQEFLDELAEKMSSFK